MTAPHVRKTTTTIEPLEQRVLLAGVELVSNAPTYAVTELSFTGPSFATAQAPARDVDFWVRFRHQTTGTEYQVWGFYDGNGAGGASGNVFKVRFAPTLPGRWDLVDVFSNRAELNDEKQADYITAVASNNPGFWEVDTASPGQRWYKRSDGSHEYVYGNTHYTFLSESKAGGASNGSSIAADINANAPYYNKLRFSVVGDLYPHPTSKPFFDSSGNPSDNGDNSHRVNPSWFHNRVDLAVETAGNHDMIADLILGGPDTDNGRSTLAAANNAGDPEPYLKYIAARYGSYPNVWLCLINEYNDKVPSYSTAQIKDFGNTIQQYLPYPTPLSVHNGGNSVWSTSLNSSPSWNDHAINQNKIDDLSTAADVQVTNHANAGANKPSINDELGYQGAGDGFDEGDIVEGHLGAFVGGGYASTGYKGVSKNDQYFWGAFNPTVHSASDNLAWLRGKINTTSFWKMAPVAIGSSIFSGASTEFRAMQWSGNEYVLATDAADASITAILPAGTWTVRRWDAMAKTETVTSGVSGNYTFSSPSSRAVLYFFKKESAPAGNVTIDSVSSGKAYDVQTATVGMQYYIDRTYTVAGLSSNLLNQQIIRTANDDKSLTTGTHLTFTLAQASTVYVAYDGRATNIPAWLSSANGWTPTSETFNTNDAASPFTVYAKSFPAGQVTLGGNMQSPAAGAGSNYTVIVRPGATPAAPSGLSASAASSSQINLSWTDNANNETGFKIERKTGANGTWAQIDMVGANVTSYPDTGLSAGTQYFYRVRSYISGVANSNYSNEANATTQQQPGTGNVTITNVSTGKAYDVQTAAVGTTLYIDRTYTITGLSSNLAGESMIRTANDDKFAGNQSSHLSFTLAEDSTVYVAYDKRRTSLPAWLSSANGWTLTSETFESTGAGAASPYLVYAKTFSAGSVTLGSNHQSPAAGMDAMYVVIVKPDQQQQTPVTIDLVPEADTYIDQNAPTTNNGTSTSLNVGGGTTPRQIFLRFNLSSIPAGATITAADLFLTAINTSTESGGTLRLFDPTNDTWSETTPTWNNPLAGTDASGDLGTLGPVTTGNTYSFANLESVVTANGQITFVIRSTVQDGAGYASAESLTPSARPTLRITYTA